MNTVEIFIKEYMGKLEWHSIYRQEERQRKQNI